MAGLDLALGLRQLRHQAANDPSFEPLRAEPEFIRLVWPGSAQLSGLRALSDHAAALASLDIRFPHQLLDRARGGAAGVADLAAALKVPTTTVAWWVDVCALACAWPPTALRLAWVDLLVDEGVDSLSARGAWVNDDDRLADLHRRLIARAEDRHGPQPSPQELRNWPGTG